MTPVGPFQLRVLSDSVTLLFDQVLKVWACPSPHLPPAAELQPSYPQLLSSLPGENAWGLITYSLTWRFSGHYCVKCNKTLWRCNIKLQWFNHGEFKFSSLSYLLLLVHLHPWGQLQIFQNSWSFWWKVGYSLSVGIPKDIKKVLIVNLFLSEWNRRNISLSLSGLLFFVDPWMFLHYHYEAYQHLLKTCTMRGRNNTLYFFLSLVILEQNSSASLLLTSRCCKIYYKANWCWHLFHSAFTSRKVIFAWKYICIFLFTEQI